MTAYRLAAGTSTVALVLVTVVVTGCGLFPQGETTVEDVATRWPELENIQLLAADDLLAELESRPLEMRDVSYRNTHQTTEAEGELSYRYSATGDADGARVVIHQGIETYLAFDEIDLPYLSDGDEHEWYVGWSGDDGSGVPAGTPNFVQYCEDGTCITVAEEPRTVTRRGIRVLRDTISTLEDPGGLGNFGLHAASGFSGHHPGFNLDCFGWALVSSDGPDHRETGFTFLVCYDDDGFIRTGIDPESVRFDMTGSFESGNS